MVDYDFLIVGAGIFGLSTAYHIKRTNKNAEIAVVDKNLDAGQGATAKSAGGFRVIFTNPVNRTLAESSVDFYLHVQRDLNRDLGIVMAGYLILQDKRLFEINRPVVERFEERGEVKVFRSDELREKLKMNVNFDGDEEAELLGAKNVDYGILAKKCGYIDADKLASFYKEELIQMGCSFEFNTHVENLFLEPELKLGIPREPRTWQKKRIAGVETNKGRITAKNVIVTAGGWSHLLLDRIGVDCISKPKKRQIFTVKLKKPELEELFHTDGFNEEGIMPFTFLPTGHYVRADKRDKTFWLGFADDLGRGFDTNEDPEERYYYDNIYPVVVKYFPQFRDVSIDNMWAGLYMINSLDGAPVIFKVENMVVATGDSGSGILKGDAVGRVAAALALGKKEAELYGGRRIRSDVLSIHNRCMEPEKFIF